MFVVKVKTAETDYLLYRLAYSEIVKYSILPPFIRVIYSIVLGSDESIDAQEELLKLV